MPLAGALSGSLQRAPALAAASVSMLLYTALLAPAAQAEVVIDGHLDESEWSQALRCDDWQRTVPFARDAARYPTALLLSSTQRGLAVAFVVDQPPHERRNKPRTPRDADPMAGDSVQLVIDFDATGQLGYEFTVGLGGGVRDGLITNQNSYDSDWDGDWQHAVRESADQWTVELFIPWSTISMRESTAPTRTIGLYASRYLEERDERYACPGIVRQSPAFLADLRRVEISQHAAASALDFIPYATALSDLIEDETTFKAGADLNWKISPSLRLSAALNPDFGQVESDELVVDFSAIETVYTDKRPFFAENQAIFELRTPANGQLIYTRRVGAAPDDFRASSSDIDVALKLTGTAGSVVYGGFIAQEDEYAEDVGRLFAATRVYVPFEAARIGYLGTWTDHPLLERDALVNALDFEITSSEWWRLSGQTIRSDIDAQGTAGVRGDAGGWQNWLQVDFARSSPVTHTLKLLHIDDRFDLNDLGYMERNSLRQVEWDTNRRIAGAAGSRVNGETQRLYGFYRENTEGQRLQSRVQLSRDVQYVSAWRAYEELRYTTAGIDDLLSRGNGPVDLDARIGAYGEVIAPRRGNWQYTLGAYVFQQGVEDYSARLQFLATWYLTDRLTMRLDLLPQFAEDWLLWEQDNLFGSFRAERLDFDFRLDWIPSPRHELRVKWQWIGIDAEARQAYRTDASGALRPSDETIAPFTVSNLGLQIRYRYEIGPLSELFLVYGRGGFDLLSDDERSVTRLLGDLGDVRDADQFLVKIRYRL